MLQATGMSQNLPTINTSALEMHPVPSNEFGKNTVQGQGFINLSGIDLKELTEKFDTFATRKTFTAGSFNLALIATKFAQLKMLVVPTPKVWEALPIVLLVFISISLLLQFAVGFGLIFLAKQHEFIDEEKRNQLIKSNNWVTILVFIIAIVNIFINIFLVAK